MPQSARQRRDCPGELELAHQPDEWCSVDDLVNATKVLALTTYDADERVFDAIRAGAAGYLLKDTPRAQFVRAIEGAVAAAGLPIPARAEIVIEEPEAVDHAIAMGRAGDLIVIGCADTAALIAQAPSTSSLCGRIGQWPSLFPASSQ